MKSKNISKNNVTFQLVTKTDIIIIGGGLAGLTAAIHLSKLNYQVILFEKESYPHHKICGEYLSKEVLPYLNSLDVHLKLLKPKNIAKLSLSTLNGKLIKTNLPLGGLGISRYALDNFLFQKAVANGVEIIHGNVVEVQKVQAHYIIVAENQSTYTANIVLGAYGKRSNLDKFLNRDFIQKKSSWLAVKAHYDAQEFPDDLVSLHNFKGGYCGLSKTENEKINVCYLTSYKSFKNFKNPKEFQENVLMQNPHLYKFFSSAKMLFNQPLSIAQISFEKKANIEEHMPMLGDAAGLIHPLCGNGMAMAIHSAKIAAETVDGFFKNKHINLEQMGKIYSSTWKSTFQKRINYGKMLQRILLNENLAEMAGSIITSTPFLLPQIIKQTHGNPIQ